MEFWLKESTKLEGESVSPVPVNAKSPEKLSECDVQLFRKYYDSLVQGTFDYLLSNPVKIVARGSKRREYFFAIAERMAKLQVERDFASRQLLLSLENKH